uniref:Uncharacterized protein n=1 Tax=Sinocyclocheilus grahami TaxID=75366 RepID=A0A672RU19_SINGR
MVPFPIVDFFVDSTGFGALGVFLLLRFGFSVAEEKKPVGLSGAEVEGDGTGFFGGPLVKGNE